MANIALTFELYPQPKSNCNIKIRLKSSSENQSISRTGKTRFFSGLIIRRSYGATSGKHFFLNGLRNNIEK